MVLSPDAGLTLFLILIMLWTLPWKGVALWKSARNKQLAWFVILFLVNTLAILEIIYLAFFQKKKKKIKKTSPRLDYS